MHAAWAFQRESELLPMFNYHLDKMQQTGVIDRLHHKFVEDSTEDEYASKEQVQEMTGVGHESVAFPFSILLAGLCVAFMQLGIEVATICKKKCSNDEEESTDDGSISEDSKEIIDDIYNLLLENHGKLGGLKFLSKMRELSSLPDA